MFVSRSAFESTLREEVKSRIANGVINSIPFFGMIESEIIFSGEKEKTKKNPLGGVLDSVSCTKRLDDLLALRAISGRPEHSSEKE